LGTKGCGEAGAIGSPPAVINAVLDALRPLGVREFDMPATPHRVWEAMRKGSVSAEQKPQQPATTAATQGRPAA
jgi:carbon-monoxide dehydrogenase large subunit